MRAGGLVLAWAAAACATLGIASGSAVALPPGWGYEMVTPPNKGGNSVAAQAPGLASSDGSSVIYPVFAAFGGAAGNVLPDPYVSSRAESTWLAPRYAGAPLGAPVPGTAGIQMRTRGVSDDLAKTVVRTNAAIGPDGWAGTVGGTSPPLPHYLHDNQTGTFRLLTPPPLIGNVPYASAFVWGSTSMDHVLLESQAILTENANPANGGPSASQWKLYRWSDGALELVSVRPDGTAVAGAGGPGVIGGNVYKLSDGALSDDGSVVWFSSPPQTSGGDTPLYRREGFGSAAETVWVNESENDLIAVPSGPAQYYGATGDGQKVLFTSRQSLVDEDVPETPVAPCTTRQGTDLYLYTHSDDPENDDNLTLVSDNLPARQHVTGVLGKSADGSRIYFVTTDDCNVNADPTVNIFLWDDGALAHLGAALPGGITGGGARQIPWANGESLGRHRRAVSADGSALLMLASVQPDASNPDGDTGGLTQVFRYGIGEGWQCLSCPPDGSPATTRAEITYDGVPYQTSIWAGRDRRALSADGGRAFFFAGDKVASTGQALVPEDTNGMPDVYMWDRGELSLVSSGRSSDPSFFLDASADGNTAFFLTWERLSGWDRDGLGDVYAAKLGGGVPEPPSPLSPCAGDQCQGGGSGTPGFSGPGSSGLGEQPRRGPAARPRTSLLPIGRAQRMRLSRGLAARVRVRVAAPGRLRVALRARIGGRVRTIGGGAATSAGPRVVRLRIRLRPAGSRLLARRGSLRIRVIARANGAADSATVLLTRARNDRKGAGAR